MKETILNPTSSTNVEQQLSSNEVLAQEFAGKEGEMFKRIPSKSFLKKALTGVLLSITTAMIFLCATPGSAYSQEGKQGTGDSRGTADWGYKKIEGFRFPVKMSEEAKKILESWGGKLKGNIIYLTGKRGGDEITLDGLTERVEIVKTEGTEGGMTVTIFNLLKMEDDKLLKGVQIIPVKEGEIRYSGIITNSFPVNN